MAAMSEDSLRTLGIAYRKITHIPEKNKIEEDLVFIGFVGMIDPPRPTARTSIARAQAAGITPIMITGDYAHTALAIARDLGIAQESASVIT